MQRFIGLLAIASCATSTPAPARAPAPSRGLHADEHLDAAREHARRAEELSRWPESRRNDTGQFNDPATGLWYRSLDRAEDHLRIAEVHRSEAAQIHAAYDEACANVARDSIQVSPLQRYGRGGMPTSDGVVVFLGTEAGPADRLLAELRCHRAWMMLSEAGMDACPLDLPGIHVQAHGDDTGISIELRVNDPKLVPELQRRAARELEVTAQRKGTH